MTRQDELVVTTRSAAETEDLARRLSDAVESGDVVLLSGDLGAGKTVFARGLAAGLGITEAVVSPTFMLAREYRGRIPMVHVDVYRLDRVHELLDLGLEDLADGAVTVVEWGDVVSGQFPVDRLEVRIDFVPGAPDTRRITVTPLGHSWRVRADRLRALARNGD